MVLTSCSKRLRIAVSGKVQGVGFRPAVYNLASGSRLGGWVRNSSSGVEIEVEGGGGELEKFLADIRALRPAGARVRTVDAVSVPLRGCESFRIVESFDAPASCPEVSPDMGICPECSREIKNSDDRRHLYPFTNCTSCGPRFTILRDVPYDREKTTMAGFAMCRECSAEYRDPADRRFHAQPNACPACGPEAVLSGPSGIVERGAAALRRASECLESGGIIAVKGLGGFHIACDASNAEAIRALRRKKLRGRKPFALMAADVEAVREYCSVSTREEELLSSSKSPVVLLEKNGRRTLPHEISYTNRCLGFMLAYTPLHLLLFGMLAPGSVLVMTSGNMSDEPVACKDSAASGELFGICDFILGHNREIYSRCDDSVARVLSLTNSEYPLRRSRGYAPEPVFLDGAGGGPPVFAAGGDLKNTFCLAEGGRFILSQHIGDLEDYKTLNFYSEAVEHFKKLFRIEPEVFACDMHPGYNSTIYARENAPSEPLQVQHHHAHIASCMADNGLAGDSRVIGAAFDGTGYGPGGSLWGGEFLICGYGEYERAAALREMSLPGGEKAVKEPWRIAVSLLYEAFGELPGFFRGAYGKRADEVISMIDAGINCPLSSSSGRLFDGVSALLGLCREASYEGEAAVNLEMAAVETAGRYGFSLEDSGFIFIDYLPLIREVAEDIMAGEGIGKAAEKFHSTMAVIVIDVCLKLRERTGINSAALSGGVFQNVNLLEKAYKGLSRKGFTVYIHRNVPPNDGGLSLGQAAVGCYNPDYQGE